MTTTAPKSALKLPPPLTDLDLKFAKALNTHVPVIWPTGDGDKAEKFIDAEQPAAIAHVFVHSSSVHERLKNARIAYLFRPDIVAGGRQKGGVASRASSKITYLADVDFVIEFNHEVWLKLTNEQRLALVDHELAHCDRDPDTDWPTVERVHLADGARRRTEVLWFSPRTAAAVPSSKPVLPPWEWEHQEVAP